jgi:hypothetical protein
LYNRKTRKFNTKYISEQHQKRWANRNNTQTKHHPDKITSTGRLSIRFLMQLTKALLFFGVESHFVYEGFLLSQIHSP